MTNTTSLLLSEAKEKKSIARFCGFDDDDKGIYAYNAPVDS